MTISDLRLDPTNPDLTLVHGQWVETDALRIAEAIHEYDPNLRVQYLEQAAALNEPPFRVIERCRDNVDRVAFTFWQLDHTVLERVRLRDNNAVDVAALVEKENKRIREAERKKIQEQRDETKEIVGDIIKSPKDTYTVPVEKEHGKEIVKFK